jgi:PAS domain S-box-containing protein
MMPFESTTGEALVQSFAVDVTTKHDVAEALWSGDECFRLLVEHSPDLILVIGQGGAIQYATPASDIILDRSPRELIGKKALSLVHPEDRKHSRPALLDFLRTPGARTLLEVRVRHADGHWIYLEAHCRNLLSEPSVRGIVVNTRDVTQRKAAEEEVQHQLRQLKSLSLIDSSPTSGRELPETLTVLLDQVIACLSVDAAAIQLFEPGTERPSLTATRGFRSQDPKGAEPLAPTKLALHARQENRLCTAQPLAPALLAAERWLVEEEKFVAYWAAPITVEGQPVGLLHLYHRAYFSPKSGWFQFLEMLTAQAAIAITSSRLVAEVEHSRQELRSSYDRTLEGWVRAVDLRDRETKGHTERVTRLTVRLATKMGFTGEALAQIRRGALLHDIGKIAIPDEVLLKPSQLSGEEWNVMRLHPLYAYEFLLPMPHLQASLDIPHCHHEKWDGGGYPQGLKGTDIPLVARIFAIVDVWDALLSNRPYRPAWKPEAALEHIRSGIGTHFDPEIVPIFLEMLEEMKAAGNP